MTLGAVISELSNRLTTLLDALPLAVALVDARGNYLSKAGKMTGVLGHGIPSRDAFAAGRWRVEDDRGVPIGPANFPTEKALRGEVDYAGAIGIYKDEGEHRFRVISVPSLSEEGDVAAVTFVRLMDPQGLKAGGGELEQRLIDMLSHALVAEWRRPELIAARTPKPN